MDCLLLAILVCTTRVLEGLNELEVYLFISESAYLKFSEGLDNGFQILVLLAALYSWLIIQNTYRFSSYIEI